MSADELHTQLHDRAEMAERKQIGNDILAMQDTLWHMKEMQNRMDELQNRLDQLMRELLAWSKGISEA